MQLFPFRLNVDTFLEAHTGIGEFTFQHGDSTFEEQEEGTLFEQKQI